MKNPGVAAVLSFLWTGLGQIYNGQLVKGLIAAAIYMFLGVISYMSAVEFQRQASLARWFGGERPSALGLGLRLTVLMALWIWGIVDAHRAAVRINRS